MRGRPPKYSDELTDKICERIATSSDGLHKICEEEGMPSPKVVWDWLNDDRYLDFRNKYARARERQADFLADEIIEIADTCREGIKTKQTAAGTEVSTGDMVERSRLQVDARKWKASKLAPKKYGDKVDVTSDGKQINYPPLILSDINGNIEKPRSVKK